MPPPPIKSPIRTRKYQPTLLPSIYHNPPPPRRSNLHDGRPSVGRSAWCRFHDLEAHHTRKSTSTKAQGENRGGPTGLKLDGGPKDSQRLLTASSQHKSVPCRCAQQRD